MSKKQLQKDLQSALDGLEKVSKANEGNKDLMVYFQSQNKILRNLVKKVDGISEIDLNTGGVGWLSEPVSDVIQTAIPVESNSAAILNYVFARQPNLNATSNSPSSTTKDEMMIPYLLLLKRVAYFTNLVKYYTTNKYLFKALHQMMLISAFEGRALLIKEDDKYYAASCSEKKNDKFGDLLEVSGMIVSYGGSNDMKPKKESGEFKFKGKALENVIYHKFNDFEWSLWITCYWYCIKIQRLLKIIDLNTIFTTKKLIREVNNQSANPLEIQQMIDPNSLSLDIIKNEDGASNKYEVINNNVEQSILQIWQLVRELIKFYDSMVGIRNSPSSDGSTRAVSDEILPNSLESDKLEEQYLYFVRLTVHAVNEQFGEELTFEFSNSEVSPKSLDSNPSFKNEK